MEIYIEKSKIEAKKHHEKIFNSQGKENILQIYINESRIEDNIETAAYCSTTEQMKHRYLGKDIDYNVYTTELEAIELAGIMIK